MTDPFATPPASLRIAVAVNPRAAFGASRHVGGAVMEQLLAAGHSPMLLRKGSYAQLAAAVRESLTSGLDALLVVGGDGMVHLGVNALAGTSVPLGVIPCGTGNDTARGLGLPRKNVSAAVEWFLRCAELPPRKIDLGLVRQGGTSVWFAGALSAGFDALVNERANNWRWPKGMMRYNLAMLHELLFLRARDYELEVDGVPERVSALLISVANGQSIGGGMKITPQAKYDDGLLDLFIVAPLPRWRVLMIFPRVFAGKHVGHSAVQIRHVKRVSVDTDSVVGYADGERLSALPAVVEIAPLALNVWA